MRRSEPAATNGGGPLSRRSFLAGTTALGAWAAMAGLLEACSSSTKAATGTTSSAPGGTPGGGSPKPLDVQLVWIKNVQFAGSFLAAKQGYYTRFGVAPNLLPGGPTTNVEPLVVQGKALVGISNPDTTAAAISNGAPLKVVATTYQRSPFVIMSLTKSPLMTPQAMIGKKIGVPQGSSTLFTAFLKANAIDSAKVTVVPVQFDPTPLATGQVDGYLGFSTDEPIILQLKGVETFQLKYSDFGYKLFGDCYIATTDTLANPATRAKVVSFLKAERLGWQMAVADPAMAAQVAVDVSGKALSLSLDQQTLESKAQAQLIQPPGYQASDVLVMKDADMQDNLATLKLAGTTVTQSQLFDTSLTPELMSA